MNKNTKILTGVLILAMLVSVASILYANRKPAEQSIPFDQKAQIFYSDNSVKIKKAGQDEWKDIEVDSYVKDGDQMMTGPGADLEVKFGKESNNYVRVAENSKVSFENIDSKNKKKLDLKHGKLYIMLNNIEKDSTFEVKTPVAVGGARGTNWTMEAVEDKSAVQTFKGATYIQVVDAKGNVAGKEVDVPDGTEVVAKNGQEPTEPAPISEEAKEDWKKWQSTLPEHLFRPFAIYIDKDNPGNHYIPSGWVGDYDAIKMVETANNPHSPTTCLEFVYSGKSPQGAGYVGVYWQNPVNNWGDIKGGYDLSGAKKLVFWARGQNGTEVIERFKVGGIYGAYGDTAIAWIGPVALTKEWQRYEIDIEGLDLSYISGGFSWFMRKIDNPQGATFYLDDIIYE